MSSASVNAHADAGLRAVAKGAYADGIKLLTQALDTHNAPSWLMERSKAYVRVDRYADALDDAEKALHIALDRGNRDLMADAQLRRAIALYRMQKFADADVCAFWAYRLTEGAKARQDDGQRNMVDENGDYIPRLQEVKAEAEKKYAPKVGKDGLLESIGRTERSKIESQRNQALTWRIQALTAMDKLPLGHDGRKIHLTEMYPSSSNLPTSNDTAQDAADEAVDPWEQVWTQYETEWHKHKIRHSFYQTDTGLTIDIFVKNLSPEQAVIESYPDAIKIIPAQGAAFGPPGGPIVIFLADRIDPQATKYTVKSMKIEVILKKETPRKWSGLRCRHADIVDNLTIANRAPHPTDFSQCIKALGLEKVSELQLPHYATDPSAWYATLLQKLRSKFSDRDRSTSQPKTEAHNSAQSDISRPRPTSEWVPPGEKKSGGGPAYPTSSKNGPKNWDNLDLDDEDEDTSKEGDVNSFFQQIYKDSDDDTRRAMMKSFVESNGTALSTSWNDASSKTYKTQPPDGAEAKKWE